MMAQQLRSCGDKYTFSGLGGAIERLKNDDDEDGQRRADLYSKRIEPRRGRQERQCCRRSDTLNRNWRGWVLLEV